MGGAITKVGVFSAQSLTVLTLCLFLEAGPAHTPATLESRGLGRGALQASSSEPETQRVGTALPPQSQ